jgi:hypothetical protein
MREYLTTFLVISYITYITTLEYYMSRNNNSFNDNLSINKVNNYMHDNRVQVFSFVKHFG